MERRQTDMAAIEAELQRLQGLVNKYDYKTPEMVTRRVQSKAFKKRPAQQYFTIEVVSHADRPAAPLDCATAWTTHRCNAMPHSMACTCWSRVAKQPPCRMPRLWPNGRASTRWSTVFAW